MCRYTAPSWTVPYARASSTVPNSSPELASISAKLSAEAERSAVRAAG